MKTDINDAGAKRFFSLFVQSLECDGCVPLFDAGQVLHLHPATTASSSANCEKGVIYRPMSRLGIVEDLELSGRRKKRDSPLLPERPAGVLAQRGLSPSSPGCPRADSKPWHTCKTVIYLTCHLPPQKPFGASTKRVSDVRDVKIGKSRF